MTLSIRAEETKAIVAALEEEYDSDKAAAKAILQLCFDLLAKRETQAVVVNYGGTSLVFGPYDGATSAKTAARLAASMFGTGAEDALVRIIPLAAPERLSGAPTGLPEATSGCVCGHAWGAHMDRQWKKWKRLVTDWESQPWQKPGCMHCPCRATWTQPIKKTG